MGQFRFVGNQKSDLYVGHPDPSTVDPDQVFTVDDEADESYSNCPSLYQVVKSTFTAPAPTPAAPSPASASTFTAPPAPAPATPPAPEPASPA